MRENFFSQFYKVMQFALIVCFAQFCCFGAIFSFGEKPLSEVSATEVSAIDVSATEAAPPAPASAEEHGGWISLFDGKTLGCWQKHEEGGSGDVKVENGAIQLGMGVMSTGIQYVPADGAPFPKTGYEIEYIASRSLGTDFFAALTFPVGDSFCTFVNGGWGGTLCGLSSIDGMDASENNTSSYHGFKNNIWYVFRVRVTDRAIRVWLDDEPIIEASLKDRKISTRIEMEAYQPLGFASWVCEGRIKSIWYRTLSGEELAE